MRQLRIDVEVAGTEQAVRELGRVDRAVDGVAKTAQPAATNLNNVSGAMGKAEAASGRLRSAAGAVAGAFGAIVASDITRMLLDTVGDSIRLADHMSDLATQTNTSASALLKLVNAAQLSGVSSDTLATIMVRLTKSLMSGDASFVKAIDRLGLSMGDLRRMSPDQLLLSIVGALERVKNGNEQTMLATEIFGQRGREALKLIDDAFLKNVSNAATWSDKTNDTLAKTADRWEQHKQAVSAAVGSIAAEGIRYATVVEVIAARIAKALGPNALSVGSGAVGSMLPGAIPFIGQGVGRSAVDFLSIGGGPAVTGPALAPPPSLAAGLPTDAELKRITDDLNKQAAAALKAGTATKQFHEILIDQRGYDAHVAKLRAETQAMSDLAIMSGAAAQGLASVAASRKLDGTWENVITGRGDVTPRTLTSAFDLSNSISLGGFVPVGGQPSTRGKGNALNSINWGSLFQQGAGIVMSGGDVGGGLGSLVGGAGGQWLGTMIKTAATAVGSAGGAMLGSVVPVVGTIVGGLLGKWVGGLFGPSKDAIATKQANQGIAQTQGGLLEQFGSVANIASTNTSGAELAAAWGSRGVAGQAEFNRLVAEFKAMTEQQNALLGEQETTQATILELEKQRAALAESLVPTWQTVSGLLEKYGISLDGAGQTVKQMATTASFKTMIDDIQTLERAGVDVGGMLEGMTDEINKMVSESVRMGTEIPLNMKPYIEELARAGKLTTDLKDIKWGAAVKTEADVIKESMSKLDETISKLGDRLKEIADMLAKMIPNAAKEGAAGVETAFGNARPKVTVDVEYNDPGRGEPSSSGYGPEGFAEGTGGLRDFGRGRLAVLHGREAVVTERQWNTMQAQASAAPAPVSVQVAARGSGVETDASMQRMADKVAQALMLRANANTAFVGQA